MTPSQHIDAQILESAEWCSPMMATLRRLIHEADPDITEEWKWNTGVWSHNGMVCAVGAFKDHVKINFFKGAQLKDKHTLINAGLDSKQHRAIDFFQGDAINEDAVRDLIREAVALNKSL